MAVLTRTEKRLRAGGTGRSGLRQAFVLPARGLPTLPVHPTKERGTPGVCGGGQGERRTVMVGRLSRAVVTP